MADETEVETVTRIHAVDIRDLYPDLAPEDATSRVCLLCGAKLKDKTHNLTRHLERHHAGALLQLLEQRNQASPSVLASRSKRVQQEKSAARQSTGQVEDTLLNAGDAKLALARWLAQEQLPVDLIEKSGFREFIEALNEQFSPPKREELRQLLTTLIMALRATCRCNEDSPMVSRSRVACDIADSDEAKIRVVRAAASLFDSQICRGKILGKDGVLGRSFVGIISEIHSGCNSACIGVSSARGTLAEYIVLPVSNLVVVPPSVPDDLALLSDDMSVVLSVVSELQRRHVSNIAILSDGPATILSNLLIRFLHQDVQFAPQNLNVFSTSVATSSVVRSPHAALVPLNIYEPVAVAHVLTRQTELALDAVVDLIGSEASAEFATSLVQSMGCVVLVDRSRLELHPRSTLAMDMNAVVVRELEVVSVHDSREYLEDALQYLGAQAQNQQSAAELRGYLLDSVSLSQTLHELQTIPEGTLEVRYLQVDMTKYEN
ncbi:Alcohol dehydrogenase [Phytophthora megakarya]|uniref:Alcohol dehydrogenase n=1 Tax=Phytophthora megakarya TaxID=4795 RepID=A0A225WSU9_9STRA|nr:Alcohol dehydrogenase [Phytophthora megakarya]